MTRSYTIATLADLAPIFAAARVLGAVEVSIQSDTLSADGDSVWGWVVVKSATARRVVVECDGAPLRVVADGGVNVCVAFSLFAR